MCQTCFPCEYHSLVCCDLLHLLSREYQSDLIYHFVDAEGNGDSVSATMHAERLALLAAVYGPPQSQPQPQVTISQPHYLQEFSGRQQSINAHRTPLPTASPQSQYPAASESPALPNYPFNASTSSHCSQMTSVPAAPLRRTPIPQLSISTSATTNARRNVGGMSQPLSAHRISQASELQRGPGNIVYQTPPSPAAMRPPVSISSPLASDCASPQTALSAGPLLPSFLKREVQHSCVRPRPLTNPLATPGNGPRSPASLSPASSTSADLPFDDHETPAKPVGVIGSGRSAAFYGLPHGASSGSSMGSSSSLTLAGGGSIWSLERDENNAWSKNVYSTTEALKGMTLS